MMQISTKSQIWSFLGLCITTTLSITISFPFLWGKKSQFWDFFPILNLTMREIFWYLQLSKNVCLDECFLVDPYLVSRNIFYAKLIFHFSTLCVLQNFRENVQLVAQCGNCRNFLSFRYYVKSILENFEVVKLLFLQI